MQSLKGKTSWVLCWRVENDKYGGRGLIEHEFGDLAVASGVQQPQESVLGPTLLRRPMYQEHLNP